MKKNFALIGAAGFIAPRHMQAIKDTGNELVVALDTSDSVGIIDSYFPDAKFFVEFERFDRHIDKHKRLNSDRAVDYVSICSPNYLHDAHIRFALRSGAEAICEKPLVLNPWNLDGLNSIEESTGQKINTILQLRLHPSIISLKEKVSSNNKASKFDVDLTYITSRGSWYLSSWKGDESKSGGIATNIGIHFFDMLLWVFGNLKLSTINLYEPTKAAGYLELERARVRWFLSIDRNDLPSECLKTKQTTFRSIKVNDQEVEFSQGFKDLHTASYEQILKGEGFNVECSRPSIELIHNIRNSKVTGKKGDYHPFLNK